MYSSYTAFAQSLRAKSSFPYSLLPPSDQEYLQNPYYNLNPNPRLLPSNGYFSRQSALLYWTPSRTFLTAAATYLATTRSTQAKLPHCTVSSSSRTCVSVQEIRSCHCHSFSNVCRDERICNRGRGRKLLEREVRQLRRCHGDYQCDCEKLELIERNSIRRRERFHEPRVSDNHEYYDYLRQKDDNFRVCDQRRRDECDDEDDDRIRVCDRKRRDEYDYGNDYRRRRDEYDCGNDYRRRRDEYDCGNDYRRRRDEYDCGNDYRRRRDEYDCGNDYRRRRDEYDYENDYRRRRDDKFRVLDRRGREEYDDYVRRNDNIRVLDRKRKEDYYDYDEEDNVVRREDEIRVSDRRRREVCGRDDNRRRRDGYYDYVEDDKIRVSDRRRREGFDERDDKIRVSDRRRREEFDERDDKIRVSDRRSSDQRRKDEYYDYDEDDKIRIMDQRRRDVNNERDDKIRVLDSRRRDEYYDYDEDDKIRITDRRRRDMNNERDDKIRVLDSRRRDEYYDYNEEDKIRVSNRMRREEYDGKDDKIRVSDRRRKDEHYDYDEEDKVRVSDRRRREAYDERDDKIRVSDQRRQDEYYDYDEEDKIRLLDRKEAEVYNKRDDKIRVSDRRRRDTYYNYDEKDKIRTSDRRGREEYNVIDNIIRVSNQRGREVHDEKDDKIRVLDRRRREEADDYEELFNAPEMNNAIRVSDQRRREEHYKYGNDDKIMVSNLHRDEAEASTSRVKEERERKYREERENYNLRGSKERSQSIKIIAEDDSSLVSRNKTNVVNQVKVSDNQLSSQTRTQVNNRRKIVDSSTSVHNQVQVTKDKRNISNQFNINETELDLQNRTNIDLQRRIIDSSTSAQNLTEITRDKRNIINQINVNETEFDIQNRNRIATDRKRVDTSSSVQNLTETTRDRRNVINQLNIQETEENVLNNTNINLTRVQLNDTYTSTETGTQRVENPSLTSGSHRVEQTTLESASRLEKSGSYHVSGFMDSVHKEFIDQTQIKSPHDTYKSAASTSTGTGTETRVSQRQNKSYKSAASTSTGTGTDTRVSQRQNKSLWGFVADIVKLGFVKGESAKLKSGMRSSSSDSRGTDDWFSGPEEFDHDLKKKEKEKEKEEELPIIPLSEAGPSVSVNVPELDLLESENSKSAPSLQEKIVLEEIRGDESTSIKGEMGISTSSGSAFKFGERIVMEESPKVLRNIEENEGSPKVVIEENEGLKRENDLIGSKLEMNTSEGTKIEEIKRGKQLKRIKQVPQKSFDEWEEQYVKETEAGGGRQSQTADVSTSTADVISDLHSSGGKEFEEEEPSLTLTRRKQFKRTSQVPKRSFDEWEKEETHLRESETTATGSTTVISELPTTGTIETHSGGKHLRRLSQVPKESIEEWEEAYIKEREQRKLDEFFMREALVEAERAADSWEVPVGAVLVRNGEIIVRGCNLVEDMRDSTAHAEMICIREASNHLRSWRLAETTLYVTLEPCAMCAGAILQARIDTVVWGAPNKLLGADGSWIKLFPGDVGGTSSSALDPPVHQTGPVHPFHPKITIRRGILETECSEIMQQFFQLRRKKKKNAKPESSSNPPCLPAVPAHPIKFFSKMQNMFTGMFCI